MKGNHLIETRLIGQAGLAGTGSIGRVTGNLDELPTLPERIRQILNIISSAERKPGYMICFIMYDITSNKVRTLIAKFLLKKGCTRVQKSIFMADMPSEEVQDIAQKLTEIQKMYDNNDSILIVPLSEDYARAMKIIGQEVSLDLILHDKNTLISRLKTQNQGKMSHRNVISLCTSTFAPEIKRKLFLPTSVGG